MAYKITLLTDEDIIAKSVPNGAITSYQGHGINGKTGRPYIDGLYSPRVFGEPLLSDYGVATELPGADIAKVPLDDYIKEIAYYPSSIPYLAFYKLKGFNEFMLNMGLPAFKRIDDVWSYYYTLKPLDKGTNFSEKSMDTIGEDAFEIDPENELPQGPEDWDDTDDPFDESVETEVPVEYEVISEDGVHYDLQIRELEDTKEYDPTSIGLFGLDKLKNFTNAQGQSFSWIKSFINYLVPISSPATRPWRYIVVAGRDRLDIHIMTCYYVGIMMAVDLVSTKLDSPIFSMVDRATLYFSINHLINSVFMSNEMFKSSKESLVRNLVETRVGRSGRATVVAAPDLPIDKVRLPRGLVYKALEQDIIKGLGAYTTITDKLEAYKNASPEAMEVFNNLVANCKAAVDRNPSLHKYNVQAFNVELWDAPAIGMPNLVDEGFNLDHDGDQMFFVIFTDPQIVASLEDMSPRNNWKYEKNSKYLFTPKHETLYGLHLATGQPNTNKFKTYNTINEINDEWKRLHLEIRDRVCFNAKISTVGRVIISDIIGADLDDVIGENNAIDDSNIGKIVALLGAKSDRTDRLLKLQNFGDKIATTSGLPAVPFNQIYKMDTAEVKKILTSNMNDELKAAKLKEHIAESIKKSVQELPDTNFQSLFKGSSRVKMSQLVDMHGPMAIKANGDTVYDTSSIFGGLSEQAYTDMARTNRTILGYKQAFVSIAGYNMRQLANAEMNIMFEPNGSSPDTVGVILNRKDAIGRTGIDGSLIRDTGNPFDKVRVKSCINNGKNVIYRDELGAEMNPGKDAAIGVSFATALSESTYQAALGLKHGGDLYLVEKATVTALEGGKVARIASDLIAVQGNHLYVYYMIGECSLASELNEGDIVTEGQPLIKSTKILLADAKLSRYNTLVGTHVASKEYARTIRPTICYAPTDGVIKYDIKGRRVRIGSMSIELNPLEMYFFPDGAPVKEGDMICTGVLNTEAFSKICKDIGMVYYCFYDNLKKAVVNNDINSDIVECLFKCIRPYEFSVENVNQNNSDIMLRLHYGDTKRAISNAVVTASKEVIEGKSEKIGVPFDNSLVTALVMNTKF